MNDRIYRYGLVTAVLVLSLGLGACGGGKGAHSSPAISVSAGADLVVRGSRPVTLFASSEASIQRYRWTLQSKPAASRLSTADISGADSPTATFTPDVPGDYVLKVMLNADHGTAGDTVKITSELSVDAGADRTVFGNRTVKLHADSNATNPAYRWRFVSRPRGSHAEITDADSADASFTPDVSGVYTLKVGVDGAADTVKITAEHVWHAGATPEFSEEEASGTSLAIAPDGVPYVAYRDEDEGGRVRVARFEHGHWESVGGGPASKDEAFYVSLAMAGNATPCIAYTDFGKAGRGGLTAECYRKGRWSVLGKRDFSAGEAQYVSLAAARDGTLYLAYQDFGPEGKGGATVRRFEDGRWGTLGKRGFSPGRATYLSLAIAPDGTPCLAYRDYEDVHAGASVEKFENGKWRLVGNRGFSAAAVRFVSLAIAADGTPYVAYEDGGPEHPSSVKKFNGRRWAYVGGNWFTTGEAESNVVAVARDGTPYMAYQDEVHRGASVRKFDGKKWLFVGRPGFSHGEAEGLSFAISPMGILFVSYRDGDDRDRVKVMSYVRGWSAVGAAISSGEEEDKD